jgi:hypothetical protein
MQRNELFFLRHMENLISALWKSFSYYSLKVMLRELLFDDEESKAGIFCYVKNVDLK